MSTEDEINEIVDAELAGDRAARLRRDAARVEELAYHQFEGRAYKVFEDELYREVQPIVLGMLRKGSLVRLALKHSERQGWKFFADPDDLRLLKSSSEARDTVMVDMVMAALKKVQRDLKQGRGWRADYDGPRGASCLASYFITQCVLVFRRAYVRWAQGRVKWARLHAVYDFTEGAANETGIGRLLGATDYVVDSAIFGTDFEEILDEQAPETQAVVRLTVMGFQGSEIADKLNITHGTVRSRLTRFRKALYQASCGGRIWIPKELHARWSSREPHMQRVLRQAGRVAA
ncbi:sigma factor-like helix-turn-helix DNA-binding protein [Streptomyces sp. NPDC002561]|uniref:sigma factor-like helix-turn-helix DNA-binding protein n=1 Tax=Streptomyces sp. NPDC002561 TaxID=3154418 RepID=UPI00331A4CB5